MAYFNKLNPYVKSAWLTFLRDPEQQQGQGKLTLVDEDTGAEKDCCLGGLCKVAISLGVNIDRGETPYDITYDGATSSLPQRVVEWAGLPEGSDDPNIARWSDLPFEKLVADLQSAIDGGNLPNVATYAENFVRAYQANKLIRASVANDTYDLTFPQIADLIEKNL